MDPICLSSHSVPNCELTGVDFCQDGSNFVTCGTDKKFHLHQVGQKYRRIDYTGAGNYMTAVSVAPDNSLILSGDTVGKICSTTTSIRAQKSTFTSHSSAVNSIHFTQDGSFFTTSSNDGCAKIWEFPSRKFNASLRGHTSWVTSSTFSPDGSMIVTSSNDRTVKLWDAKSHRVLETFGPFPHPVSKSTYHPNGTIILVGLTDGSLSVIDVKSKQVLQHYEAHTGSVTSIQVHPTGFFALTAGTDKKLCIWDLIEGQLFYTISAHQSEITEAKWNKDGSKFVSCDRGGSVRLWQTNFDKLLKTINTEFNTKIEDRREEEMNIAPNPPRAPKPAQKSREESTPKKLNEDAVESALDRMVNQLEVVARTATMMEKRLAMQEEKLGQLQRKKK